jgi:hypothetical protein
MGLKFFFKSKLLRFVLIGGFLLNFSVWLLFWLGLDFDKTALIIHYNSFFGIDKFSVNSGLNRFFEIFFAPLSGLFLLIINYLLGGFLIFSGWKKTGEEKVSDVGLEKLPASMLGGFLILIAGVILQMTVLVYSIAIFLVNRG